MKDQAKGLQFYGVIIGLWITSVGCTSEASEQETDTTTEPSNCECNELILDEGYNHFYLAERNKGFNGTCTDVYPNGQKSLEKNFVDGKIHGKMTEWHENGRVSSEREFDMNLQVGEQINYSETGEVTFHALYKRGKQTDVLVFKAEL